MRILYILFFFFIQMSASAQKVYFIYLQSDNGSPFYVKMKDKIYSSSQPGYLILSNLVDSTYQFSLGFSSSQPEARFIVPLGARDRGFLIKEFDQGPGLFDLQTLSVIRAQTAETKNTSYQVRKDDFTTLLARAANDTSLLYVPVYAKQDVALQEKTEKQEVKVDVPVVKTQTPVKSVEATVLVDSVAKLPETIPDRKSSDSSALAVADIQKQSTSTDSTSVAEITTPDSSVNKQVSTDPSNSTQAVREDVNVQAPVEEYRRSVVKKYSESSTSEGFGLVFHDNQGDKTDTIRILIPNPLIAFRQEDSSEKLVRSNEIKPREEKSGEVKPVEEKPREDKPQEVKTDNPESPRIVVAVKPPASEKSKCRFRASNNDFFRLRKNMAAKESDDAMINEANRFFKTKCFTTEQVRNLSTLFLTSSGKYQFFDAAYSHVSDQENFPGLESEIREEYFLNRFKTLVGR